MCGIIGYLGSRPAAPLLLEGLATLEYRGYDSAGVAIHEERDGVRTTHCVRTAGKIAKLVAAIEASPTAGTHGIGHTRWATHGGPTEANAHPHLSDGVSVVHNGIIENHATLRAGLTADGFQFRSETDTEVIAHLIARELKQHDDLHTAVQASVAQSDIPGASSSRGTPRRCSSDSTTATPADTPPPRSLWRRTSPRSWPTPARSSTSKTATWRR
ncbi:MAG: hypothetical protein ACPHRO_04635 [Nannocystaceae bacterium]